MSKCLNCKKYEDCVTGSGLTWPCGAYVAKDTNVRECEYCGGGHFITSVTVRSSMVGYDDYLGKVKVNYTDTLKPPKFCPECGRRLEAS